MCSQVSRKGGVGLLSPVYTACHGQCHDDDNHIVTSQCEGLKEDSDLDKCTFHLHLSPYFNLHWPVLTQEMGWLSLIANFCYESNLGILYAQCDCYPSLVSAHQSVRTWNRLYYATSSVSRNLEPSLYSW